MPPVSGMVAPDRLVPAPRVMTRQTLTVRDAQHARHFLSAHRGDHHVGRALRVGAIVGVGDELCGAAVHLFAAHYGPQLIKDRFGEH